MNILKHKSKAEYSTYYYQCKRYFRLVFKNKFYWIGDSDIITSLVKSGLPEDQTPFQHRSRETIRLYHWARHQASLAHGVDQDEPEINLNKS